MRSQRWFQRRKIGLGWRPADWHGWVITVLAAAGVVAVLVLLRGSSARIPVTILIIAGYAVIALATGGTSVPEGAAAAAQPAESEPETGSEPGEQRQALQAFGS